MKLFTTCYTISHTAEEAAIAAKYDLLIVNQNTAPVATAWLDSVKALKPGIKILAYQIVAEEPGSAPGPGNAVLMNATRWSNVGQDPWLITASGDIAAIQAGWRNRRMFDYRKQVWKDSFKEACAAILSAYPFDGLFFDNCTASWAKHAPSNPAASTALQDVLLDIRRAYPSKWLIGNCVESWMGLNGEMNEGRIGQIAELAPVNGQNVPNLNCYYLPATASTTDAEIQAAYDAVQPYGAWFGVHTAALSWPAIFDTLEAA